MLVGDKAAVAAHEAAAVFALRDAALEMVGVRQSTLGVVNGGHGATVAQAPVADKKAGSDPEVDESAARQGTVRGTFRRRRARTATRGPRLVRRRRGRPRWGRRLSGPRCWGGCRRGCCLHGLGEMGRAQCRVGGCQY